MKIIIIEFNHQNNHNESNSHVCYMSDSEHFWVKKYAHAVKIIQIVKTTIKVLLDS